MRGENIQPMIEELVGREVDFLCPCEPLAHPQTMITNLSPAHRKRSEMEVVGKIGDFKMYLFWEGVFTISSESENGLLNGLGVSGESDEL